MPTEIPQDDFVGISHDWPRTSLADTRARCRGCGLEITLDGPRADPVQVTWKMMVYGVCPARLPETSDTAGWLETVRDVAAYEPDRVLEVLDLSPPEARRRVTPADLAPALTSILGTEADRLQAICAMARLEPVEPCID